MTASPDPAAIADTLGGPTKGALRNLDRTGARWMLIRPASPLRALHLVHSVGHDTWTLTPLGAAVVAELKARRR